MTTTTSTYPPVDLALWLYPGESRPPDTLPVIFVTGPVNGLWTIDAPDEVTKAQLDAAIALQQAGMSVVSNREALLTKATAAVVVNNAFLAVASPTNAQVVAQVRALTRQNNALIKLITNNLSDVSGT